ncbi:MAG: hypothetical protein IJZ72_04815 [Oscillospiraceae bacterium]|nr:hypothetical protein [Oscillospiraceae bacterium]
MRDYYLHISIESDRKHIYILPSVPRLHDRVGITGYKFYKLKYSSDPSLIGKNIKEGLGYIVSKYVDHEGPDYDNNEKYKGIPWRKRSGVSLSIQKDGTYSVTPTYVDHEIMSHSYLDSQYYPSDVSDEELGKGVLEALERSYEYSLRKEIAVYFSEKEGLLFVPMALNRTGFVLTDFCRCVKAPYNAEEIRSALDEALKFAMENPEDKRTNKERKENLPWREYSKYKSMHGFVKTHYCFEIHILPDGTHIFMPTLRWDSYDSQFIEYSDVKKTYSGGITDEELKAEIFESLEICDLIYKKHDQNYHHEIFFAYVEQLGAERNRR